jgi:hypothetical protein
MHAAVQERRAVRVQGLALDRARAGQCDVAELDHARPAGVRVHVEQQASVPRCQEEHGVREIVAQAGERDAAVRRGLRR